ncbi:glycosyltransferase family 2 protein [Candidatus Fermentibacteria bacterium]|nr:glycosyltransferase family 2 protein [Candidatus Fermentibacteria bacterium]
MSAGSDVSIIVVHYKDVAETARCVASLGSGCAGLVYEIVLVDNSPSQELVSSPLPDMPAGSVVSLGRNAGLARATNFALRRCTGRYYLCLNPDVVATPQSIRSLVCFADSHPHSGIVAARLENGDRTLQLSCRRFYTLKHALVRRTFLGRVLPATTINADHLMEDYDHSASANVDWVLGSCMLVRATAVADIGPMDERFFLYFEDVDWCYRMHKGGWDVVYFPGATMIHLHKRDSAVSGLNRQKLAHLASFVAFHDKHGWALLWRRPDTFRLLEPVAGSS